MNPKRTFVGEVFRNSVSLLCPTDQPASTVPPVLGQVTVVGAVDDAPDGSQGPLRQFRSQEKGVACFTGQNSELIAPEITQVDVSCLVRVISGSQPDLD